MSQAKNVLEQSAVPGAVQDREIAREQATKTNGEHRLGTAGEWSMEECGQWACLLTKRARLQTDEEARKRDLNDAQRYLTVMQDNISNVLHYGDASGTGQGIKARVDPSGGGYAQQAEHVQANRP